MKYLGMQYTAVTNYMKSLRDLVLFIAMSITFSLLMYCIFYLEPPRRVAGGKRLGRWLRLLQLRQLIPRFMLDYAGSMSCCIQ